ncbi:MAG: hypothetical protein AAB758_01530 [Patescibacteria group bacterium]
MLNLQPTIYNRQLSTALALAVGCVLLVVSSHVSAYTGEFYVDTKGENINAIEGTIHIPTGVNINQIQTGRSIILMWLSEPKINQVSQAIYFSGISPGGFKGKPTLFSFSGELNDSDLGRFTYSHVIGFLGDGSGSATPITLAARVGSKVEDSVPPEEFVPIIYRSEDIFEGEPFISFLTQDKGVGILQYEYATKWFFSPNDDEWQEASSPLRITTKDLFKKIYVKAIDKAGNERIVNISGTYYYAGMMIGIIIISCVILLARRFLP